MEQEEVNRRTAEARRLHEQGCNCCQAVVMAFADLLPDGVTPAQAMMMAKPFGRGLSGLCETCGCVTGMALVCGLTGNAMMTKGLGIQFKEQHGDLNCGRLLQQQGPQHSCAELVASAAALLAESL